MQAAAFRRDRFLRASGYHLAGWALLGIAFSLPRYAAAADRQWQGLAYGLYFIVLLGLGAVMSLTAERHVAKMVESDAGGSAYDPRPLWVAAVLAMIIGAMLVRARADEYLEPLWLTILGAAWVVWGRHSVRAYLWLGSSLVSAGAVGASLLLVSGGYAGAVPIHLWNASLAAVAIPTAVFVSRRYLWSPAGASPETISGDGRD